MTEWNTGWTELEPELEHRLPCLILVGSFYWNVLIYLSIPSDVLETTSAGSMHDDLRSILGRHHWLHRIVCREREPRVYWCSGLWWWQGHALEPTEPWTLVRTWLTSPGEVPFPTGLRLWAVAVAGGLCQEVSTGLRVQAECPHAALCSSHPVY